MSTDTAPGARLVSRIMRAGRNLLRRFPSLHRRIIHLRGVEVPPQGAAGIRQIGHRAYVGGLWDEVGRLQFEYLLGEGLSPENHFLDIGCGSLRGGRFFIDYLLPGRYAGVEKEAELVRAGREEELGEELFRLKRPQFIITDAFEFSRLDDDPEYALAQSLFTHLPPDLIQLCLARLRSRIAPQGRLYATFFETDAEVTNPAVPHDHWRFLYTQAQMKAFGSACGWKTFIGDWEHPRGQKMCLYVPA